MTLFELEIKDLTGAISTASFRITVKESINVENMPEGTDKNTILGQLNSLSGIKFDDAIYQNNILTFYANKKAVKSVEILAGPVARNNELWKPNVSNEGIISWKKSASLLVPEPQDIKGPKGDRGPQGPKGDVGSVGPKGDKGITGDPGPIGPQGLKGDRGLQGETGPRGETGLNGEPGIDGKSAFETWLEQGHTGSQQNFLDSLKGAKGEQGIPGVKGDKGDRGLQGEAGPQGPQGLKGERGPIGPRGEQGNQGPQGEQGLKGNTGATGPIGPKGDKGDRGIQGEAGKDGTGINILGSKDNPSQLPPTGQAGDGWLVQGDLYVWDSANRKWINVGSIKGPQGDRGPTGAKGDTGLTGAKGEQGIPGIKGNTGDVGPQGAKGETGAKGDTGLTGAKGEQGIPGIKGDVGPQGPKGATGATGPIGPKGDKGDKGKDGTGINILGSKDSVSNLPPTGNIGDGWLVNGELYVWNSEQNIWLNVGNIQGPKGDQGERGIAGPKGDKGDTGLTGERGPIGPKGETGPQGPQGLKGDTGEKGNRGLDGNHGTTFLPNVSDTGELSWANNGNLDNPTPVNIKGPKGDTGATGATGPKGNTGDRGPQGATGAKGEQGPQGDRGSTGATGATGPIGPQGERGLEGPKGATGATGPKGDKGDTGTFNINETYPTLQTTNKTVLGAINEVNAKPSGGGGSSSNEIIPRATDTPKMYEIFLKQSIGATFAFTSNTGVTVLDNKLTFDTNSSSITINFTTNGAIEIDVTKRITGYYMFSGDVEGQLGKWETNLKKWIFNGKKGQYLIIDVNNKGFEMSVLSKSLDDLCIQSQTGTKSFAFNGETPQIVNSNSINNNLKFWTGTQIEYDAIEIKDDKTLYFIKEVEI